MGYKTILAALSGGTASDGVMELACRLARRFEAHVEGFHVQIDPRQVLMMAAGGFGRPLPGEWIDKLAAEAAGNAAKTKKAFEAAIALHGLPVTDSPPKASSSANWHEQMGHAPMLVARRARFFDLVVLGRSERVVDLPHTDAVEESLFRSGRPILLAPAQPPDVVGEKILLGWNGSPEAVRAMTASLPFLAAARSVTVMTIGEADDGDLSSVTDHLAWHSIVATHRYLRPTFGLAFGQQLLAAAQEQRADMLVMGGYGHMPWREFLLGGATREVVRASLLPVLLSH